MADQGNLKFRARKRLDQRLRPLQSLVDASRPPKGWIKAIREALGMNTRQLARRLGITQSTVVALEANEALDSITLGRLRDAAQALDCQLVYALVPRESLQSMVEKRARSLARAQLARTHHSMALEDQALDDQSLADEEERLVRNLMLGSLRQLWEEDG